ncbi:hypothetical protein [Nitrosovibrio sp. Nv17]|uniref:hypothetical protein n=1 Tax=Nitrosovibrio sp. Nv17 TaxID=1855339 RepID=UPI0009089F14|nr:hypothetical protein [Nitrosovibrio sp. Nv17]SFW17572.1 hypothetical protein SAMN05216414_10441 [Nitrosovibrio sp. Nv17]
MKSVLAALSILCLGGCALLADRESAVANDGRRVYSITGLYDGESGSREQALYALDIDARNLCGAEYTRLSEEARPIMNPSGSVVSSRLVWEIRCHPRPAPDAP